MQDKFYPGVIDTGAQKASGGNPTEIFPEIGKNKQGAEESGAPILTKEPLEKKDDTKE